MSYEYGLLGVANVQSSTLSNVLTDNFIKFYDWAFVEKGGYINIARPSSGMYGGNKHELKPVNDPAYADGRVWETYRQNWVYQTGVDRPTPPCQISGVYVDNSFLPYTYNPDSGKYIGAGYRMDFENGKIIFDSPQSKSSVVSMDYSVKWLKVDRAEGVPFFRNVQQRSFRLEDGFFSSSGNWVQMGETRVQLPALFIEAPVQISYRPYQLGGGQWAQTDIVAHVLAENSSTCVDIIDIISYQNDRDLFLFDPNRVYNSGDFALNYRGDLIDPGKDYKYLVDQYNYGQCRIYDTTAGNPTQLNYSLYLGTARFSVEIPL
jgi:hypothetical protein